MSESDTLQSMFRLLHEIRSKQGEHDSRFSRIDNQLAGLNKRFDDWQETTATRLGLATHANLRNTAIEAELEALKRRVEALEGSLRPTGH
ncbi:hypothetical protein [Aureimonas sp. SK2]|uniref:hypothetical protein n=1 Tax=Aureimonas sp. SK2 TaxID=3015992 RepID=UPI00244450A6|nr:hypothetical protein [Aureimonas sp. SK2]